jgi:hypothetical protein
MKRLVSYNQFLESLVIDTGFVDRFNLLESLNIWHDLIFTSIGAEEVNPYEVFNLPNDFVGGKLEIDNLSDNIEFINSLASIALKKSDVKTTDDFQTFINKPIKFLLIYDVASDELENPKFILVQVWNDLQKAWQDLKCYKLTSDIGKFYDKLTSKTVEITDGDQNYIYTTSNANEWVLQNSEKENDVWQKVFRNQEFEDLINSRKVRINII